jgi:glyoxylase-like metal-dependent hydrolase (beta-lactamase superfamily II)
MMSVVGKEIMKRSVTLSLLVLLGLVSIAAAGLQGPAPAALDIRKVKDNLYMVVTPDYGAGNTAVFITDNGVVLVDTKTPGNGQSILDKVKTVTQKPVTTIINTHSHQDHSGSNDFFKTNVEFVAHENTRANMQKMSEFSGANAKFIPAKTFKDRLTIGSGKDRIDLYYFGRAHTSGDAWVVFPAARTVHSGDAFAGKNTPLIDTANGGSAAEYPETIQRASAALKDIDTIITGHSALMTPADLKEYADFNKEFIDWVKAEIKAGKTAEAAAAEYKLPARYKDYRVVEFFGGMAGNIQTAYKELKK